MSEFEDYLKGDEDFESAFENLSNVDEINYKPSGSKQDKLSKSKVNYRESKDGRTCGNCVFFKKNMNLCYFVEGDIDPDDVCVIQKKSDELPN